jgi:uncharacterized protein DUF2330
MRNRTILGVVGAGLLSVLTPVRDARACGGCFQAPGQSGTVVTDHRMIFSVSPQETSLYDEIKYSGSPSSFAWVLPIRGQVTVGLSSDAVFASLEQATRTTIVAPFRSPCPCSCCRAAVPATGGGYGGSADAGAAAVTVIAQQTIGPYDTVQLQSSNANALDSWLATNGYVIPADVQPIVAAYVQEGFDFLALKLAPGQGVQAMRPVRVSSPGAGASLPLRMVAAGTGATVGITLWVIADGRYEPQNFQFFTISPSELSWDWSVSSSNYATVRAQKEATFNNWAWQIESSLSISPYQIETPILYGAVNDYTPVPASDAGDGGGGQSADQVRRADLATLFPNAGVAVRITRMRADLSHPALTNDLVLQASTDQTVLSNVYQVTQSVNAPQCPPDPCSNSSSGGTTPIGSTSSSGSGASSGSGGSGGSSGGYSGGSNGNPAGIGNDGGASPGAEQPGGRGCAASPTEPGGAAVGLLVAGFLGVGLVRARRKRS